MKNSFRIPEYWLNSMARPNLGLLNNLAAFS
jgi:hypothetical protein